MLAHVCGIMHCRVATLGVGAMQYSAKVMAMAFTALICKLEQCHMVVCEFIVQYYIICA